MRAWDEHCYLSDEVCAMDTIPSVQFPPQHVSISLTFHEPGCGSQGRLPGAQVPGWRIGMLGWNLTVQGNRTWQGYSSSCCS